MNMGSLALTKLLIVSAALLLPLSAFSQIPSFRAGQARTVITRIETRTVTFRREVQNSLDRTPVTNTNREDRIADFITDFQNATAQLRSSFNTNRNVDTQVTEVLNRAASINRFMARNRLSVRAETEWTAIRTDLDTLARYYSVSWDWNRTQDDWNRVPDNRAGTGGFRRGGGFDSRLTGTYRLNRSLSDDVNTVLDRWDNVYTTTQRDRARRNLERRLTSPEMIAIEMVGRSVSMASSLSPQVTFDADGVAKTERTNRGQTIRTTATATREAVEISYVGDRANDFYLTLSPTRDGQLRVTRRLYLENRNETVSVSSVYDKISDVAQWSSITMDGNVAVGGNELPMSGEFYIANGTRLVAVLNNTVTSRATQVGDRFTMNVTSPAIYRNAVIEGRVAQIDNSGRVSGRANVSLEFDTIRMRDGRSYRFAGIIDSVRSINGDAINVSNEGTVRDGNQTTRTATRAGVGAALGALIGAIAGGGSGAAIGAAVGAGAGAGTVLIQGRDNVELGQGTEFHITATGPATTGVIR